MAIMLNRFFYKSYRLFFILDRWRKNRLTPGGLIILPVLLISAGIGIDTFQSMTYQEFTFLAALFLSALLKSRYHNIDLDIKRHLPRFGTVGKPLKYRITVINRTAKKQCDLALTEQLEDPRPTFDDLITQTEPDEAKRNRWDRKTMYFRWTWLVAKNRKAVSGKFALPVLPAQSRIEHDLELMPLKRGVLYFEGFHLTRPDILGLYNSLKNFPLKQKIIILPKRYQVPDFDLPGTRTYQPGGIALASSVGNSEEFVSLRDYRPGDPLRHMHWKSLAKIGKPVVKEFQDEFFVRHALILDTFLMNGQDEVFEEAVSVAASLACTIQTQESLLDLMFVGDQAYRFASGRGLANIDNLLEILSAVRPCIDKPFSTLSAAVSEHASLLSGCIMVLLDWDPPRQALMRRLRARGIPIKVLVIVPQISAQTPNVSPLDTPPGVHLLTAGHIQTGLASI